MDIIKKLKDSIVYIDGGLGSLLQKEGLPAGEIPEKWSITHPEKLIEIHKSYIEAGAQIITTNTFGANELKLDDCEYSLKELVFAAVDNVDKASKLCGKKRGEEVFAALSIGPSGKLLEPLGDLEFEKAVEAFSQVAKLSEQAGADLVIIETMSDTYEAKAALLAVKESCDLPVIVTMAYDEHKKLMTGADPVAVIAMLESLRADAIGLNCGLGPHQMKPIAEQYVKYSSLPIVVSPNAGLPRSVGDETVYDVDEKEFAKVMREIALLGVHGLGGCCGTTPKHIKEVVKATSDLTAKKITAKNDTLVSSYTTAVRFSDIPVIIGERINPTGKPKLKQALRKNSLDYILSEAVSQQDGGADILDINVGLPEIDEVKMLCDTVKAVQSVSDLPLQLDSSDPKALEKAMRIYNGKPMINSVNGKQSSMDSVFSLVRKYGGVVVALTLDENGIPDTVQGRLDIAKKIINEAKKYSIDKKDIVVDALAMAVSSDKNSANITIETVRRLNELGVNTVLGVSNISFGLPQREFLNSAFLTLCFENGLSSAIMNPTSREMMKSYYSFLALKGKDNSFEKYIAFAAGEDTSKTSAEKKPDISLEYAVEKGFSQQAFDIASALLKSEAPLDIVNKRIIPALNKVGSGFEKGSVFLPQLLMSAEAAKFAFDAVKGAMKNQSEGSHDKIVLATVEGDIHDIGKNIVKVLLQNYGFEVIDLGRDVKSEDIVNAVIKNNVTLLGLSALMTTTVPAMEKTIKLVRERASNCKIAVGGAVLTQEYADMIGADFYSKDAMETVRYAQRHFGR